MNDLKHNPELLRVKDITKNICEVYKEVAMNKEISLGCSVEDSFTIFGDKNQIEFIVRNMVNNAIKFTNKGGIVNLAAKSFPEGLVDILKTYSTR